MPKLRQINFDDALLATRDGKKVYVTILGGARPTTKLFNHLTIKEAIEHEFDYIYQIVEE